jgi:hypothetical protein
MESKMKTLMVILMSAALVAPATAAKYECFPTTQEGGGDTRRIVLTMRSLMDAYPFISVVHELGSGRKVDRMKQYEHFGFYNTNDLKGVHWDGNLAGNGNVVGDGLFKNNVYTEILTNTDKREVVAKIIAPCDGVKP